MAYMNGACGRMAPQNAMECPLCLETRRENEAGARFHCKAADDIVCHKACADQYTKRYAAGIGRAWQTKVSNFPCPFHPSCVVNKVNQIPARSIGKNKNKKKKTVSKTIPKVSFQRPKQDNQTADEPRDEPRIEPRVARPTVWEAMKIFQPETERWAPVVVPPEESQADLCERLSRLLTAV
nr:hypothetical protein TetV2_00247 [Oceanusvirus sp.]